MRVSEHRLWSVCRLSFVRLLMVLAAIAAAYSCQDIASAPPPPIDARIWRMIRCIECIDNERGSVVSMQDTAVPALRYLLLHGPPDSVVAHYDSSLRRPRPATPPDSGIFSAPPEVVDRRVQNFIAFYRIRSSIALGLIGSDSARRTLCEGKALQLRDDVRRIVDSSLKLLNGVCQ